MNIQIMRQLADRLFAYLGTFVILVAVLIDGVSIPATIVVIVGLLLLQVGVWHIASQILPSERKNSELRASIDVFIDIVRDLRKALPIDSSMRSPTLGPAKNLATRKAQIEILENDLRNQTEYVIDVARKVIDV